jgi:hypothetical protein
MMRKLGVASDRLPNLRLSAGLHEDDPSAAASCVKSHNHPNLLTSLGGGVGRDMIWNRLNLVVIR